MFPSNNDPLFGVFVKNFKEEFERNSVCFSQVSIIKGKTENPLKKLKNYLVHYVSIFKNFFQTYDLIYVHYLSHHVPIFYLFLPFKKKPWVFNTHGTDIIDLQHHKTLDFFAKRVLKKADLIIVPTEYFKNKVIERYPFLNKESLFVSPSGGIDPDRFFRKESQPESNIFHLGFISRFIEEKGWKTFLSALSELKRKKIDFTASIAGKGPDKAKILQTIEEYDLGPVVNFLGLIPQDELLHLYNSLDLYVFPTYREAESLGLTGLEAMACGVPVIACKIAGPATYIQTGKNGFLFEPKNVKQLVNCIVEYHSYSNEQKMSFRSESLETARKYRKDLVAKKLIERLEHLLKQS